MDSWPNQPRLRNPASVHGAPGRTCAAKRQARAADDAYFFSFLAGLPATGAVGGAAAGLGAGAGGLTAAEGITGVATGATGAAGGTAAAGMEESEFMVILLLSV